MGFLLKNPEKKPKKPHTKRKFTGFFGFFKIFHSFLGNFKKKSTILASLSIFDLIHSIIYHVYMICLSAIVLRFLKFDPQELCYLENDSILLI